MTAYRYLLDRIGQQGVVRALSDRALVEEMYDDDVTRMCIIAQSTQVLKSLVEDGLVHKKHMIHEPGTDEGASRLTWIYSLTDEGKRALSKARASAQELSVRNLSRR